MKKENEDVIATKLDEVIGLLQHLVALQLSDRGATQEAIGKSIHVAKSTVVKMLAGARSGARFDE
jgi:predicted transcriptional regulator